MEQLCLGCGKITKSGARRVVEAPNPNPVSTLLKNIIESRINHSPVSGTSTDTIFSSEKFMCRPCYGKYQRVIELYADLALGVDSFILKMKGMEEEAVIDTCTSSDVATAVGTKRKITDNNGPQAKKSTIFARLDASASPAVSVSFYQLEYSNCIYLYIFLN